MGENRSVPFRLAFELISCFSHSKQLATDSKRKKESVIVRKSEMNSIIAKRFLQAASTGDIPPTANRKYEIGKEIIVLSELLKHCQTVKRYPPSRPHDYPTNARWNQKTDIRDISEKAISQSTFTTLKDSQLSLRSNVKYFS